MIIKLITHNSKEYWELVSLRDEILRKPLNLKFSEKELLAENNQYHFAVFDNNKIIAGLILLKSSQNEIKMRQVCVANKFQSKGIGKALIRFAENWAKANQFTKIYCHARKNALSFYNKLEYQIEGNIFIEVGLEHYKLRKIFHSSKKKD